MSQRVGKISRPLQTRRSLGYVYSSAHISDDDAETELRTFEGKHAESLPSHIVKFRVGRRQQQWAGNCVAIGLSGGFIEPLESTGLYLSQIGSEILCLIEQGKDLPEIVGELSGIFDGDKQIIEKDAVEFTDQLISNNIVCA